MDSWKTEPVLSSF